MDPFEEFEFKPLSEGLGFHKKNDKSKEPLNSKKPAFENEIEAKLAAPLFNSKTSELNFTATLPRKEMPKINPQNQAPAARTTGSSALNEVLQTLKNRDQQFKETAPQTKKAQKVEFTTPNISAILLDTMLVLAMNLLCLIALLVVTKVDLNRNLSQPDQSYFVYLALVGLGLSMTWIYMVTSRVFLGHTPGEWVFETQTGTDQDKAKWSYAPKVAWRSLVVIATGLLPLTLVSWLAGVDIAGVMSGCKLVKSENG